MTSAASLVPSLWHTPEFGRRFEWAGLGRVVLTIVVGCAAYGFTIGAWRGVELGAYVAIKLPLVILLTVACNGLLNGIFSQLLGSGLGFRQSVQAILESYGIFAVIVASLAPISAGVAWQLATSGPDQVGRAHAFLLVSHTAFIAYAGLVAHLRMYRALLVATRDVSTATKTFLAWTAGNLFAGAQIAYVLRPYAVTPGLTIAFLREHPLEGNFYQAIWHSTLGLMGQHRPAAVAVMMALGLVCARWIRASIRAESKICPAFQANPNPTKP